MGKIIAIAKTTENNTTPIKGLAVPNKVPIAIPAKAPCPKESEKKAILLLTTIVPSKPNNGITNKIAKKAFFIKL